MDLETTWSINKNPLTTNIFRCAKAIIIFNFQTTYSNAILDTFILQELLPVPSCLAYGLLWTLNFNSTFATKRKRHQCQKIRIHKARMSLNHRQSHRFYVAVTPVFLWISCDWTHWPQHVTLEHMALRNAWVLCKSMSAIYPQWVVELIFVSPSLYNREIHVI